MKNRKFIRSDDTADISRRTMLKSTAGLAGILALGRAAGVALAQESGATTANYDYPKKHLWDVDLIWDPNGTPMTLRQRLPLAGKPAFDMERLINSPQGEALIDHFEIYITTSYPTNRPMSEEVLEYYANLGKGLKKEMFEEGDERWSCYTPMSMHGPEGEARQYPVMMISHGGTGLIEFEESNGFMPVAARDEVIVVAPQNQEKYNMVRVLEELKKKYPVDASRVYGMGYSNGGSHLNLTCLMRPDLFAAIAPSPRPFAVMGGVEGSLSLLTDNVIRHFRNHTVPMICIGGQEEVNYYYPFYQDPIDSPSGAAIPASAKIELLQRRLRAMRCRVPGPEEFYATRDSDDIVKRNLGIPFDRTSTETIMGLKHWIGDFMNDDGNYYLRLISIENMPHFLHPTTAELSWNFVKRFSKVPGSNELVDAGE